MSSESTSAGLGIGSIIALIISVALNKSFLWAIIHLLFGWFYVVYALMDQGKQIIPAFISLLGL